MLNAAAEFTSEPIVTQMAGFEGLISGLLSMYLGAGLLINEGAMREVLPLGEPRLSKIIIPDDISQLFD
jgi:succinate-acetate transporter protein